MRLKGRLLPTGRVSWGQVDKLLPPPSGRPFRLPDLTVDTSDTTDCAGDAIWADGVCGRRAQGNLSGGFAGKLAASSPGLAFGACRLDRFRAFVDIGVTARRPQVKGPIGAQGLQLPGKRPAPGAAADGDRFQLRRRVRQLRWRRPPDAWPRFEAGANGMAGDGQQPDVRGTPARALGRIDLAAQQARLDRIVAGRTRFEGRYRLDAGAGR